MTDPSPRHTSLDFEVEMRSVRERFASMARCCGDQLQLALEAFWTGSKDLSARVEASDNEVDAYEKSMDEMAFHVLALRQPVASDLRTLTAVLKLVTDLERIGDEAVDIARGTAPASGDAQVMRDRLRRMAETSEKMFHSAVSSFLDEDVAAAQEVRRINGAVDVAYEEVLADSIALTSRHPTEAASAMAGLNAAKCLRRMADHAKNIAEGTLFVARGEEMPR
jgi:phosphate transport system protein